MSATNWRDQRESGRVVLDPTNEQKPAAHTRRPRPKSFQGLTVGLLDISKPRGGAFLDRVEELTQVIGFVLSTDDFGEQPKVLNGASDLLVEVLGAAGKHTRAALGANALPFSVTIEIAAVAVVRTG